MSETVNILVINGPNLNMLGTREPEIYGADTLGDVEANCRAFCEGENVSLDWMQTNSEAEIVTAIHLAINKADWILINAAGLTHCSVPLRDALALFPGRKIEIHLSNIHKRESFRHHSMISAVVDGVVLGFGAMSYVMAVKGVIDMARETK